MKKKRKNVFNKNLLKVQLTRDISRISDLIHNFAKQHSTDDRDLDDRYDAISDQNYFSKYYPGNPLSELLDSLTLEVTHFASLGYAEDRLNDWGGKFSYREVKDALDVIRRATDSLNGFITEELI